MTTQAAPLPLSEARKFILAGNATFTVVSVKTGKRFTYTLAAPKLNKDGSPADKETTPVRFLRVRTGGDEDQRSYAFAGTVFNGKEFRASPKARIPENAPSVQAFRWLLKYVINGDSKDAEIWHAGRCGRCGRQLTVPSSILTGLGPECAGKVG